MIKKIFIASHHGFCMGVKRAIQIAEDTAGSAEGNVTILNEIVHNEAVVEKFNNQGVGQTTSVENVNDGTLIISAHGIAPNIIERAQAKGLTVVDATCPLVTNIYDIITEAVSHGYHIIHYGNPHHDETMGIVGYSPENITVATDIDHLMSLPAWEDRKLGLTVQTTAHIEEFARVEEKAKEKWPHIKIFNTICNATTKRQNAIMELAPKVDMVLVVGSTTSANSKRLAKISNDICGNGKLIGTADDINESWFEESKHIESVGVSAGASTPDFLVEDVIKKLVEISGNRAEVILPEKRRKINKISRISQ